MLGIELLAGFNGVVDAGKGGGLATTVSGAQAEYADLLGGRLVEGGELLLEVGLGDTGLVGVDDVARKFSVLGRLCYLVREAFRCVVAVAVAIRFCCRR